MELGLKNKCAVVGGASKGLGFAVAKSLLEEGANVTIASRNTDNLDKAFKLLKSQAGKAPFPVRADLTQSNDRIELIEKTNEKFGSIDILVSNTKGPPTGSFESHNQDNWRLAMELALGSVTHLCSLVLPQMKKKKNGKILQIVSIAAMEVIDGLILSCTSRPAVLGFAKTFAREVAPFGILINSICPGMFKTDRMLELAKTRAAIEDITIDEYFLKIEKGIPIGRMGNPKEVGDLAAFLVSDKNTYITGAAITIDGAKTRRLY